VKSKELMERARRVMPGGVNSPVRAFRAVGGEPPFIARASGSRLFDVEGKAYLDYLMSWGAIILGHTHPVVVEAIEKQVKNGTSFGTCHELEVLMAEKLCAAIPSLEMVRLTNSGTEAVMSALRLARGYTGRELIVKFKGCYHGHVDGLLVQSGSGLLTLGIPASGGIPVSCAQKTIPLPYNGLSLLEETFRKWGEEIAAVIVEPVAGNMGVVPPREGFLETLRRVTTKYGALLIFDEVITGFRVSYQGAQGFYGVTPDLTVLGKIIGGGLPVGAYGGRREIMLEVAPEGNVYQAGTLSGNPVTLSAGYAVLEYLSQYPEAYGELDEKARYLAFGLKAIFQKRGIPVTINRVGSMFTVFFTSQEVTDGESASRIDQSRYASFFQGMLREGIYLPPSQFEAWFVSLAHTSGDLDDTLEKAARVTKELTLSR